MRDDIINKKRQKVKIWTNEDYELVLRDHVRKFREMGWLIPYLFLKYGQNNENEESNKQGGDEE